MLNNIKKGSKNNIKTFVIGDIHGGYKSLVQCLKRSKFNYKKDRLICLGDVVDGYPETPQVIEELLKIKDLILIEGNHDTWAHEWFQTGARPIIWTEQGGKATIEAYIANPDLMVKHRDFFKRAVKYYVDDNKRVFVHGGFKLGIPIEKQKLRYLTWDRELYDDRNSPLDIHPYTEAFIGHTSISRISKYPFCRNKVWFMDTGGGYEWKLSILDVDSKKFWQSEKVSTLYPRFNHR